MEARPLGGSYNMSGGSAPAFAHAAIAPMSTESVGAGVGQMPVNTTAPIPMSTNIPMHMPMNTSIPMNMNINMNAGMPLAMNMQMLALGAMSRVGAINTWELKNNDDPRRTCSHVILRHRTLKHGNLNYYPGVLNLTRPPWFADVISEEDWKNHLMKFNRAVYDWWQPGDVVRTASIVFSFFLVFPLICYFACDESGDCCFKNRKKIQLMKVAEPILKELTSTTPFEWTLEWRPELFERADAVQNDFKTLQVCLRLKEPIGPEVPRMDQTAYGASNMMGGLANMNTFQPPQQPVPLVQAVPIHMSHMQKNY
jgi:hypothetical protein